MRSMIHSKSGGSSGFPSGGTWTLSSDLVITGAGVSIIPGSSADTVFSTKSLQSTAPLGDELVTNNSFDSDLSGWTIGGTGTGWSWDASGAALHTTGNTDTLYQNISIINGETYQVEITISGRTAGYVRVDVNGVYIYNYGSSTLLNGNATYKRSLVGNATGSYALTITPSSDFDGMITLITVKQITGEAQPNYVLLDDSGDVAFEARVDYGLGNLCLGVGSGRHITTGYYNTFSGFYAGYSNTTGNYNAFTGYQAGYNNTIASYNTFTGYQAGFSNTTGYYNIFTGYLAGYKNTTGYQNTFTGSQAGFYNTTGYSNTFTGPYAGHTNTTGRYNTFTGYNAGYSNTTGYQNTATGYNAGRYLANGTSPNQTSNTSVYIGAETKAYANGDQNEIVIGYNAVGIGSNSVVLGNDDIATTVLKGNVGIGTTPSHNLHVYNDTAYTRTTICIEQDTSDDLEAELKFYKNTTSLNVDDIIGAIRFKTNIGAGDDKPVVNYQTSMVGVASGAETALFALRVMNSGTLDDRFVIRGNNIGFNTIDQFGSGEGVFSLATATTIPSTNPTGAVILYFDGTNLVAYKPDGSKVVLA